MERRSILWGMRRNSASWSAVQLNAMHWLQRANLKSARAWRLKMALREVFAKARHNPSGLAAADRRTGSHGLGAVDSTPSSAWITLKTHFDAVVCSMLNNRSNAFVEAMTQVVTRSHTRELVAAGTQFAASG